MKKLKGFAVIAFLLFFVITNPHGAAAAARIVGSGISAAASGFGQFFTGLNGGGR